MHTFFTEKRLSPGSSAELNERERDHLFKILRARPGDEVELFDGRGGRMTGVVREGRRIEILTLEQTPEPERKLHLCCAVPRRAKFDVLLKQAAELGVWSIRLVEWERSVSRPEGSERWRTLLQEGCKQSKNPFLPGVVPPRPLAEVLMELKAENIAGCFGAVNPLEAPLELDPGAKEFAWLVGPEGGFTPQEESALREAGLRGVNLGAYVLRLETAAVCGLAVLYQKMREMRS